MIPFPILSTTDVPVEYQSMYSTDSQLLYLVGTRLFIYGTGSNLPSLNVGAVWKLLRTDVKEVLLFSEFTLLVRLSTGTVMVIGWDVNSNVSDQYSNYDSWSVSSLNASFNSDGITVVRQAVNYAFSDGQNNFWYYNTYCAYGSSNRLRIWGWNKSGQFGTGSNESTYTFNPYSSGSTWINKTYAQLNGDGILTRNVDSSSYYGGNNTVYQAGNGSNDRAYSWNEAFNRTFNSNVTLSPSANTAYAFNMYSIKMGVVYGYGTYSKGKLGNGKSTGNNVSSTPVIIQPASFISRVHQYEGTVVMYCDDGTGYYVLGEELNNSSGGSGGVHTTPEFVSFSLGSDYEVLGSSRYGNIILHRDSGKAYGSGKLAYGMLPGYSTVQTKMVSLLLPK